MASRKVIPPISKGDVIAASWLMDLREGVIDAQIAPPQTVTRPNTIDDLIDSETGETVDSTGSGDTDTAGIFTVPIVSYESDVVRVFNPDDEEQWVDVARFTSITLLTPSGDLWRIPIPAVE